MWCALERLGTGFHLLRMRNDSADVPAVPLLPAAHIRIFLLGCHQSHRWYLIFIFFFFRISNRNNHLDWIDFIFEHDSGGSGTVSVALGRTLSVIHLDLAMAILVPAYNMASILADLEGRHLFSQICQSSSNCTSKKKKRQNKTSLTVIWLDQLKSLEMFLQELQWFRNCNQLTKMALKWLIIGHIWNIVRIISTISNQLIDCFNSTKLLFPISRIIQWILQPLTGGNGTNCWVGEACGNFRPDPLAFDGNASGRYLTILACQAVVFLTLLALSEHKLYDKFKHIIGDYRPLDNKIRNGRFNILVTITQILFILAKE